MKALHAAMPLLIALAAMVAVPAAQDKSGSPEDHLPPDITQLTAFGERASWSPDGQRIAFMAKSFGDAFVVDVRTKMIRLLTQYANPGFSVSSTCPTATSF